MMGKKRFDPSNYEADLTLLKGKNKKRFTYVEEWTGWWGYLSDDNKVEKSRKVQKIYNQKQNKW